MESIGERIIRLRKQAEWSRPELGRQMAKAIAREKSFTGELVRKYETGENEPSNDARKALAIVFKKTERYIEFGDEKKTDGALVGDTNPVVAEIARLWEHVPRPAQDSMLAYMRTARDSALAFTRELERLPLSRRKKKSAEQVKAPSKGEANAKEEAAKPGQRNNR